ncbi:MAG: M4 family metallopeptidase [Myxococcales bacterium]|nr:M4 family metallopeptidase [Myxococcales bacterium]HQY64255.1 M4 family metallopeptidase [Polyangiaceae bacterium]
MKKVALVLGGVSLGLLAVACSGGNDEPAPFTESPRSVQQRLAAMTGARWEMDPGASGKPRLYYALDDGDAVLPSAKDPKELLAFLEPVREGLGLSGSFASELDQGAVATEAAPDRLATMVFTQHVPGTALPVFDSAFVAGVRPDGSLAFVDAAVAHHLDRVRTTPAFDPASAREKLHALGYGGFPGHEPTLGVVATDPDVPALAYRTVVDSPEGSRQVDLDALTGAVLADAPNHGGGETVMAYGGEEAYQDSDPKKRRDARYPVEMSTAGGQPTLAGPGPLGDIVTTTYGRGSPAAIVGVREPSGTVRFDFNADAADVRAGFTEQVAVNAFYNTSRSARYFKDAFDLSTWIGGRTTLKIHRNSIATGSGAISGLGNAFFDSADASISIGDGVLNHAGTAWEVESPATNIDFMAHEYSHGVIATVTSGKSTGYVRSALGYAGEQGAINEGIADILASYAQAVITQNTGGRFGFAENLRADNKPLRHFLHPSWGTSGGAVHYSKIRPFNNAHDNGNVHFNSLIVTQAWALMAYGGFNDHSHLGVSAEIGLEAAKWLVYNVLHALGPGDTMRTFADKMIVYQIGKQVSHPTRTDVQPLWAKHAIICGWAAVGVIPPEQAKLFHNVTCPASTKASPSCAGKVDGVYCDPRPDLDYASYTCDRGSIKAGAQCARGQFCYRTTGSFDSKARVDERGAMKCFAEPQLD